MAAGRIWERETVEAWERDRGRINGGWTPKSHLYRAARLSDNVHAASRGPGAYSKRVVRQGVLEAGSPHPIDTQDTRVEQMNLSSEELHDLRADLNNLSIRLIELDERITEDSYDARRSLTEAFRHFNRLARIFDPELVVTNDVIEAEDEGPDESC